MALLPYLVYQYEEPNEFCVEAATRIAEVGLMCTFVLCLRSLFDTYTKSFDMKDCSFGLHTNAQQSFNKFESILPFGIPVYLKEAVLPLPLPWRGVMI